MTSSSLFFKSVMDRLDVFAPLRFDPTHLNEYLVDPTIPIHEKKICGAWIYYYTNQIDKAIIAFSEYLELHHDWEGLRGLGWAYISNKMYLDAISVHSEASRLRQCWSLDLALGISHFYQEQFQEAYHFFKRSLKICKHPHCFRMISLVKLELKEYRIAIKYLKMCARLQTLGPDYLTSGYLFNELGQKDAALKSYEIALSLNPEISKTYYLIAELTIASANYEDAKSNLIKALSISENWKYYFQLGLVCILTDQVVQGVEYLIRSLLIKPNYESYMLMAILHSNNGRVVTSKNYFLKLIELDQCWDSLHGAGLMYKYLVNKLPFPENHLSLKLAAAESSNLSIQKFLDENFCIDKSLKLPAIAHANTTTLRE